MITPASSLGLSVEFAVRHRWTKTYCVQHRLVGFNIAHLCCALDMYSILYQGVRVLSIFQRRPQFSLRTTSIFVVTFKTSFTFFKNKNIYFMIFYKPKIWGYYHSLPPLLVFFLPVHSQAAVFIFKVNMRNWSKGGAISISAITTYYGIYSV